MKDITSQNKYVFLKEAVQGNIYFNYDITRLTSFKIGGPVDVLVYPKDIYDLKRLLKKITGHKLKYIVVGNLSNVLVSDKGYRGIMINLREFSRIVVKNNFLVAQAGVQLSDLTQTAKKNDLTGAEFYMGIPSTVGGAVVSNTGSMGFETSEIVDSVKILKGNCRIRVVRNKDLRCTYRKSSLQQEIGTIVISVKFKLRKSHGYLIQKKMRQFKERKKTMQPIEFPSAGCIFINRVKGYYVNDILKELNLCGLEVGGAKVSEKYPNYIINTNHATHSDVIALMGIIKKKVRGKYGITLKEEIKIIE